MQRKEDEVWCMMHTSDNHNPKWTRCRGCCAHCKDPCADPPCMGREIQHLCAWRASPIEWVMGQLSEDARKQTYNRRRYEWWLRNGFKPYDGSWEGMKLAELKDESPEYYRLIEEGVANESGSKK